MKLQKINTSVAPRLQPRKLTFLAALAAVAVASMTSNHAALDTNITGIVTDLTTFFGSIQTLVISVVVFGLAIGYAKMLRKH